MYPHTRMCFQMSSAFLVGNLSVWETCLCWLNAKSSLHSSPEVDNLQLFGFSKVALSGYEKIGITSDYYYYN